VGVGEISSDHVAGYESGSAARVVAISDISPLALAKALDRWRGIRAYRDYNQMLREVRPDVVSVCTWPQSHAEIVCRAAAAGVKGILCEKPMALTQTEMDEMVEACDRYGAKLAVGHQYRFHPNFVWAADVVRSRRLGEIRAVRGHIVSTIANNGPHMIDTVRFVLGDVPAREATCKVIRERTTYNRALPAEESASGHVIFADGVRLEFQTGDASPSFFSIEIEGTNGTIVVTPQAVNVHGSLQLSLPPRGPDCRRRQFGEFVAWVKGKRATYAADAESSQLTGELVLALYESARQGGAVMLPLNNHGDVLGWLDGSTGTGEIAYTPSYSPSLPEEGSSGNRLAMDGGTRAVRKWFSAAPAMGLPELAGVTRVVLSRQLNCVDGRAVKSLERECAKAYGSPCAVASTSGTAAIHVALAALNLNPGDEVITTPLTDMGSIIPILASNCVPVFADVDPGTGSLTAESIAQKISPRTKAVILVHLFGRPAELGPICDLLSDAKIPLIEDCAQAHFAEYQGRKVGTFGAFGCFSLQQSKQITCGDGGLTLVNAPEHAERAKLFVDKGWDRKKGLRSHGFLGMNYRMTELQGAVALAQIRRLSALIASRRASARQLSDLLSDIPGLIPPAIPAGVSPSWWTYPFRIDEEAIGLTKKAFGAALRAEGVRVATEYVPEPVFNYPVLREQQTYGESRFPFSLVRYEQPELRDYPGFQAFNERLLFISWSHNVRDTHVRAIAEAARKIVTYTQTRRSARAGVAVGSA
jgi:dTDP-4-amino-4,6-dideoxygalactose transaminase/predicted dehydrogenase